MPLAAGQNSYRKSEKGRKFKNDFFEEVDMDTNISNTPQNPISKPPPIESGPVSPGGSSAPTRTAIPPTPETVSTGFQPFKEIDTFDQSNVVIQQFTKSEERGFKQPYLGSSGQPILPFPDPEGNSGPQPFEPSWKKAIDRFFKERVKEKLSEKMKEGGNVDLNLNRILNAQAFGKLETLSKEELQIIEESTSETQKAWALPPSWNVGSTKPKDWTPVNREAIAPVSIEFARREILCNNVGELLESLEKTGNKVMASFAPNDPNNLAASDFIRVIASAIRDLKGVLRNLQLQDAEMSKKFSKAKLEDVKLRTIELENITKKNEEAMKNRLKQEKTSKAMKIFGLVMSAVALVVSVLAIPVTGGASVLIIAGIIVSATMLAYTALDFAFDVTSKAVQGCGKLLEKMAPGDENAWVRKIVKYTFAAVMVAVVICAIVFTGGAATGNVVAATTAQIVKAVAIASIRQLAIQASMIALMSSNVIPELGTDLLIKSGALGQNDEDGKMIAQIIFSALQAALMVVAVLFGARSVGRQTVVTTGQITQTIKDIVAKLGPSFPKVMQKLPDILRMASLGVESGFGIYIGTLGIQLGNLYKDLGDMEKSEEMLQLLIKLFTQILNNFQEGMSGQNEWLNTLQNAINSVYAAGTQISNRVAQGPA